MVSSVGVIFIFFLVVLNLVPRFLKIVVVTSEKNIWQPCLLFDLARGNASSPGLLATLQVSSKRTSISSSSVSFVHTAADIYILHRGILYAFANFPFKVKSLNIGEKYVCNKIWGISSRRERECQSARAQ